MSCREAPGSMGTTRGWGPRGPRTVAQQGLGILGTGTDSLEEASGGSAWEGSVRCPRGLSSGFLGAVTAI